MTIAERIAAQTAAARARTGADAPVLCSTVKPGQEITESDTPQGPWYRVAKVNRCSLVIQADNDDPSLGTIRFPFRETDTVLVRDPA